MSDERKYMYMYISTIIKYIMLDIHVQIFQSHNCLYGNFSCKVNVDISVVKIRY